VSTLQRGAGAVPFSWNFIDFDFIKMVDKSNLLGGPLVRQPLKNPHQIDLADVFMANSTLPFKINVHK
jgi:hypothetical protein